jgi:CRISPR-associated protein Csd1
MLNVLLRYAETHNLEAEPGFEPKTVRWGIKVDESGRFLDVVPLGGTSEEEEQGQEFAKCPALSQSELVKGSEARTHFLIESARVVALYGEGADLTEGNKKHDHFVSLLQDAGKEMPELGKLADALGNPEVLKAIRRRMESCKVKPADKVTFLLDEKYLVESTLWHDWWRSYWRKLRFSGTRGSPEMRCFGNGELSRPAITHLKIKGLRAVGGSANDDAFICFDKPAFESYSLEQAANAALSEQSMWKYRAAINELLRRRNHPALLAGAKVLYWFKKKVAVEDDPLAWLQETEEQQELNAQQRARALIEAIRTGKREALLDNFYYALTISGSSGRVMVRDWMEGQFDKLVEDVLSWFEDLAITNISGSRPANAPSIERVVTALLPPRRPKQDYGDWIRPVGAERLALWHAAARGDPVPHSALTRVVVLNTKFHVTGSLEEAEKQNRNVPATLSLLYTRMGLMKAYHNRKKRMQGGKQMASDMNCYLNEEHQHPAYHCGRLMAVLAALQRSALGDVGAGVVQRYYAAASATPALVLGRLTRTSQFHLNKLDPGLAHWYENRIADIWCRIKDAVPSTLDLEEQSVFALGYYQQIASRRPDKSTGLSDEKNEEENRE